MDYIRYTDGSYIMFFGNGIIAYDEYANEIGREHTIEGAIKNIYPLYKNKTLVEE